MKSKRRAKIVCTLGPACSSPTQVRALVAAGMDVARLNLSHGDYAEHAAARLRSRSFPAAQRRLRARGPAAALRL